MRGQLLLGIGLGMVLAVAAGCLPITSNVSAQQSTIGGQVNVQQGTFTVGFDDACTTTPTITFGYVKIGPVVTLTVKTISGSCTSDSSGYAVTTQAVPAFLRPPNTITTPYFQCVDAGVNGTCVMSLNYFGTIQVYRITVSGSNVITNASWTNTGNKAGFANPGSFSFSYYTSNP